MKTSLFRQFTSTHSLPESQPNSAVWEKPKISPNGKNLQNILLYPKSLLYSDSHHLIVWLRKKKIPYSSQDPAKRTENSRNGFLHFSKDQLEEAGGNSQNYFEK